MNNFKPILRILLCGLLASGFSSALSAQAAGSLDATFGTGGTVQVPFLSFPSECHAMALQSDGKVVLGGLYASGGTTYFAFTRLNANGTADNTFGTSGKATFPVNTTGVKLATLQLASGNKIIAAGSSNNLPAIMRLTSAGAADNTFGTSGIVTFDGGLSGITDMVVLADGKMLGCGLGDQSGTKVFAAFRRNADGTADNTFGTSGFAYANVGTQVTPTRMAVQSDGKVLMTGTSYTNATTLYDLVLYRFNANGTADNTFGTNGKVTGILAANSAYEQGNAIAIQPDGKILVAGRIANAGPTVFVVVRYNTNGTIDNTFGTSGKTTVNFYNTNDEPKDIAIQADGKILVVGSGVNGSNRELVLARLTKAGALDNTFDSDGKVATVIGTKAYGESMAIQPDGKILVGGYATISGLSQFFAARYNPGSVVGTKEADAALRDLGVFPNPLRAGAPLTLRFELEEARELRMQLIGLDGRLIEVYPAQQFTSGKHSLNLELPARLPSGQLLLRVETEAGAMVLPLQMQR